MKKNIIKYAALVTLAWGISACTDNFDKFNTNDNAPTAEQASPNLLLTNAIESSTDRLHSIGLGHEIGAGWVQFMAKAQYTDEDRYQPRVSELNTTWNSFYSASGQDIAKLLRIAETSKNTSYQAVGLIMQAHIMAIVTDLWGSVPFDNAFKGDPVDGGILSPAYNTQEEVYRKIIANLKTANTLLSDANAPDIAGDILFDDDLGMWQKFSNSLRLRLLLRMSAKDVAFATAEMTEIVGDPAKFPIFEAGENAALQYLGAAPNNNPINENRKTRDDHRVSKHTIDLLLDNSDDRLFIYALPSSGTNAFVGIPNGLTASAAAAFNGNGLSNTSKIGTYFVQPTTPGTLLSYSELQFILAEAVVKGLIPGDAGDDGDAEAYYNEGIIASFETYRSALQDMIDNSTTGAVGTLPLPESVDAAIEHQLDGQSYDPANALEQIATQKYIAMFDQGLQAWFEWRRTRLPELTPAAAGLNSGKIPVRLQYPLDEETKNPTELKKAKDAQVGNEDMLSPVWWDPNN
jgi:hypothetical protein